MVPFSPQPSPWNAGAYEQRGSWSAGSRPTDSLSWRRPPPPRSSAGRRVPKRIAALLAILVLVLIVDAVWLHGLIFTGSPDEGVGLEVVDKQLLDLLVRQKDAMEAKPPVEEIQAYADRFKVLLVSGSPPPDAFAPFARAWM